MIKSKLRLFGWAVGLSLALGAVGAVVAQGAPVETKADYDSATAATMTAGTNGSTCVVNGNDGIKVGTSSKGGDMQIAIPAGTTKLYFRAAAWKGVSGLSLNLSGANATPSSFALNADNGVSNTSPFTLAGNVTDAAFNFVTTLANVTSNTNVTLTTSIAKRFVIWGAKTEINVSSVSLSSASADLAIGGNVTLTATVLPANATNKNVTWSSSNPSVATVSGGIVTGVGAGTATVTVTTQDGSKTATCEVTVVEGGGVAVTGVSLDKDSLPLLEGKTGTLVPTVSPDDATIKTVSWASSNESVATVADGTVTAIGPGDAVITVTTANGGFEDTCDVHVTAKSITGISVAATSAHKTNFTTGETLDTTGLVIRVQYDNDTSENVSTGFAVTEAGHEFVYDEVGSFTVHITMGGFSTSYSVAVSNKIVALQRNADKLQRSDTGVTGTSYEDWTITSGFYATYAGNSAGGNESIQLRSSNSNSGIVAASPTLTLKKIVVEWNSNTAADREIDVYGKNSAYTAPTDLYNDSKGTSLGSIVYGTSTELEIEGDYRFIGIRSKSGALYLTSVTFVWESTGEVAPSVVTELGTFITNKMNLNVTKDTGACLGDNGLYLKAKQAYNGLSENAQLLLTTSTSYYGEVDITSKNREEDPSKILYRYSDIKARYEKWATFNNDAAPYDGYDDVHTKIHGAAVISGRVSDSARTPLLVAAFAGVGALAVGGMVFLRKRKEF